MLANNLVIKSQTKKSPSKNWLGLKYEYKLISKGRSQYRNMKFLSIDAVHHIENYDSVNTNDRFNFYNR